MPPLIHVVIGVAIFFVVVLLSLLFFTPTEQKKEKKKKKDKEHEEPEQVEPENISSVKPEDLPEEPAGMNKFLLRGSGVYSLKFFKP